MFGFEFQTNGNLFLSGVRERDTAWTHDEGLLTLEGDETFDDPDRAELEFVTKACADLPTARRALDAALQLATGLQNDTKLLTDEFEFTKGTPYRGGQWNCNGKIQLRNREFEAKPQVTVGIPLTGIIPFFQTALTNIGSTEIIKVMQQMGDVAYKMLEHVLGRAPSEELLGFVCACHYLVIGASNKSPELFGVDATGLPVGARNRHDSWRIFDLDSSYLYGLPAYRAGVSPKCRVLMNSDSPKSLFGLLHRTDFHAMYRAIHQDDPAKIPLGDWINILWPYSDQPEPVLFPVPYRSEPVDNDYQTVPRAYRGRGWDDEFGKSAAKIVDWSLMEHGPTLREWWDSVVNGRLEHSRPGDQIIPKDLASPPPGLRGRRRDLLAGFPKKDEDKRGFYSMGAFPIDKQDGKELAVYEFRAFANDKSIADLMPGGLIPLGNWKSLVERFHTTYIKF